MAEHDWIARYFAPLASAGGAAGLSDDVAELTQTADAPQVVTVDALVEGVHFLPDDPLESVARKLVRVNVSDILSAGALPAEALLTLGWPEGRPEGELKAFADALGQELSAWDIALLGGDTVRSPAGLFLSLTLTGKCLADAPVRRSGARAGDDIWMTGEIGAARRGFEALSGEDDRPKLAYREPQLPRREAAMLVAHHASAAMDVSDGLLGDLAKMAAASGVRAHVGLESVPFSGGAADLAAMLDLATWGDDYQLLFAAGADKRLILQEESAVSGVAITRIGSMTSGEGLLATLHGTEINLPETLGFEHG